MCGVRCAGLCRYGAAQIIDTLQHDGLTNPVGAYKGRLMGDCAELCSSTYGIGRTEQDEFAASSYARSHAARASGKFKRELVEVRVAARRGAPARAVDADEESAARGAMSLAALGKLPTAFQKTSGTVTAGNASTISDGGAALVVASARACRRHSLNVLAVVRGCADAAQAPELFTTAPALAIPKALERAGVTQQQVDFFELNEAFAVVGCANTQLLGLDADRVNVYGGAVSMGHPLGASGARIIVTLLSVLAQEGGASDVRVPPPNPDPAQSCTCMHRLAWLSMHASAKFCSAARA